MSLGETDGVLYGNVEYEIYQGDEVKVEREKILARHPNRRRHKRLHSIWWVSC
jgi:hypothetical protein